MQFTYPRMGGVRQGPQTDRRIIPESRIQGAEKGKVWCGEGLCGSEKWCDVTREAKIPVLLSYCLNSTCVLQGHIHHASGKKTLHKAHVRHV